MEGWERIEYETRPWTRTYEPGTASRSELRRHVGPYPAAVPPLIADRGLPLPSELLAAVEDATSEVVRFDGQMGGEIAPFQAVLLRSEAAASSQIENLTASARAIAEAELGVDTRPNARLIVDNTRALDAAVDLAARIDASTVLQMHRVLMAHDDPEWAGRWRKQQVWIGGGRLGPHQATFVPPHHERVLAALDDLFRFAARDDLPILAQAAAAHAQFETIHPFRDGNGRAGRALLLSTLRSKGLTRNITVPLSAGLLRDTSSYFAALTAYREGSPEPMVEVLVEAAFVAVTNGRQLVTELRDLRSRWQDRVAARRDAATWRVADLLLRRPVVNAPLVAAEAGVHLNNVYRALQPLLEASVLREQSSRRRDRIWRCDEVLQALDAFAARAGRRTLG